MDAPPAGIAIAPSDDRTCAEHGRDAVAQAVEHVQQRLGHYRAAGELAVTFGWPVLHRKLRERIESALGQAPAAPAAGGGGTPEPPAAPAAPPAAAPPPPVVRVNGSGNGAPTRDLPIPSYDSLSASQVVERLAGLPAGDLEQVRGYEAAHRNRRTILGKIEQLLQAV